jgi:branched-chain amino acid transport system substrate-binding protein
MPKTRVALVSGLTIVVGLSLWLIPHWSNKGGDSRIVVGMIADQTGDLALYGKWAVNGATLAIEKVNQKGGIGGRQFELQIQDGMSSPQAAVNAANQLTSLFNVQTLVIATGTGSVMAVAPICNRDNVVLLATLASGPIITEAGDFVFRDRVSGVLEVNKIADYALRSGINRMALALLDNEAGKSYEMAFRAEFEKRGGHIDAVEWLKPGGGNYRTQVIKIVNAKIQAVFFGANVKEVGDFIKQATEMGFRSQWMAMTSIETDELFKIVGEKADGLIYAAESYDYSDSSAAEFDSLYTLKFNEHSQSYSANNYDAIMLLADCISKGAIGGRDIRDQLYKTRNYHGVSGTMSFDKNGDVMKPVSIKVIRGTRFESLHRHSD